MDKGYWKEYDFIFPKLYEEDLRVCKHVKSILLNENIESRDAAQFKTLAIIKKIAPYLSKTKAEKLAKYIVSDMFGYGPIDFLVNRYEYIEDIFLYPNRNVMVYHRDYGLCKTNFKLTEDGFKVFINAMIRDSPKHTKQFLSEVNPTVDLSLSDGSRLKAFYNPIGSTAVIRVSPLKTLSKFSIPKLISRGELTPECAAYLWDKIESGANIVISGAPGSGKTTLLSTLTSFIPPGKRILVVEEEIKELVLNSRNLDITHLLGGGEYTGDQLLIGVLRMRPDRVIIGELRGSEAKRMFFAANVGVPFMCTMHSNESGMAIIDRLMTEPMSVPREHVKHLDVLINVQKQGNLRVVKEINEFDGDQFKLVTIFKDGKMLKEVPQDKLEFLKSHISNKISKGEFDDLIAKYYKS